MENGENKKSLASMSLTYNLICDNVGDGSYGAGVKVVNYVVQEFSKNTLSGNTTTGGVGGLYVSELGDPTEVTGVNNIIYGNTASSNPDVHTFSDGKVNFSYTCCTKSLSGTGNMTSNPRFVNAGNGDYHLQENSLCIDAGDPDSPKDPDGTRADMGALYFPQGSGIVYKGAKASNVIEILSIKGNRAFLYVPLQGNYSIKFFSLDGRLVTSNTTRLYAGNTIVDLNTAGCASGRGIIQITSDLMKTEKLFTLLK